MDMNKTFYLKNEVRKPQWKVIDAQGRILGRLATEIADILRGKHYAHYTPHIDAGDYVVVINADKVVLTGKKWQQKVYEAYSGWIGGLKVETAQEKLEKHPTDIIYLAVKRMLPKNKLADAMMKKLRVYVGTEHPHQAQI